MLVPINAVGKEQGKMVTIMPGHSFVASTRGTVYSFQKMSWQRAISWDRNAAGYPRKTRAPTTSLLRRRGYCGVLFLCTDFRSCCWMKARKGDRLALLHGTLVPYLNVRPLGTQALSVSVHQQHCAKCTVADFAFGADIQSFNIQCHCLVHQRIT